MLQLVKKFLCETFFLTLCNHEHLLFSTREFLEFSRTAANIPF